MPAPGSRVVIRRYATRARGIVEICDLEQQAALTALEVERRPDIRDRDSYETRAVAVALLRLVAETKAPVSLPVDMGPSFWRAAGSGRVPMFVQIGDGDGQVESPALGAIAVRDHAPLEDSLDTLRTVAKLHRLLERESAAARAVLLDEEKPAAVATRLGESVSKVYAQTARAMRNLRAAMRTSTRIQRVEETG